MPIVTNTPEKLILRLNISESLANSIRRSVNEIPTLAVSEVEIFKNDSALYDEVLALRLGLLPLKTEKSMTEKTKVEFKLSKKGPCTVYASDLSGAGDIIYPEMPLTIIKENHTIELVASAILGTGLEHSKHVPGLCFYRHLLEVKSTNEIDKIVQKSKSDFKPEKVGQKWVCDLKDGEMNKIISLDNEAINEMSDLLLVIESYGTIPSKDILSGAIKVLNKNLSEFEKALK